MNPLAPPPNANEDPNAQEMVRAWVVNQGLHCSLNVGLFGDNEQIMWGILLSDIARHVANAMEKSQGTPAPETLRAIAESFNFELRTPTADTDGGFTEQ